MGNNVIKFDHIPGLACMFSAPRIIDLAIVGADDSFTLDYRRRSVVSPLADLEVGSYGWLLSERTAGAAIEIYRWLGDEEDFVNITYKVAALWSQSGMTVPNIVPFIMEKKYSDNYGIISSLPSEERVMVKTMGDNNNLLISRVVDRD